MNGIYVMYFTGVSGSGIALFLMKDGEVAGADMTGGTFDGRFRITEGGSVAIEALFKSLPGTILASGETVGPDPKLQKLKVELPSNFSNGSPILINMPTGPINAIFKLLRELP